MSYSGSYRLNNNAILRDAVDGDNIEIVEWLLSSRRCSVNEVDMFGESLLEKQMEKCNFKMAEILLRHKADASIGKRGGFPMLQKAILFKQPHIVELLIKAGAYISGDNCDSLVLQLAEFAAKNQDEKSYSLLLTNGANVSSHDDKRNTMLHSAIKVNCGGAIVKLLLSYGAEVNPVNKKGKTPLHVAAKVGDPEVVQILLAAGADVTAKAGNSYGDIYNALHFAAKTRRDNRGVAEQLIEAGIPMNEVSSQSQSPLQIAIWYNNINFIRVLLEKGVDVDVKTGTGLTPLHAAVHYKRWSICETLLNYGADINAVDLHNSTVLHRVRGNESWMLQECLDFGADPNICLADPDNRSPLMYQDDLGHDDNVKVLMQYMLQMEAIGKFVNESDLEIIHDDLRFKDWAANYLESCLREVDIMNVTDVGEGITIMNILNMPAETLVLRLKNDGIFKMLKSRDLYKQIPIYGHMLKLKVEPAYKVLKDLYYLTDIVNYAVNYQLPSVAVDNIVKFLKITDIEK